MGRWGSDPAVIPVPVRSRFMPTRLLHLLWTVPLASALAAVPAFYGSINICGISGCTGGGFGVSYGPEVANWVCAIVVALIFTAAVGAVPWARPRWVPIAVGALVGIVIGGVLIAGWLGSKYQYYPAGIDCYPAYSYSECEYGS